MSIHKSGIKRKTVTDILCQKGQEPLVCLTAYTAPMARIADQVADLVLVGDSLGMVLYGMESTVPVTLEMMVAHGRAVVLASARALIVIDMPFGYYQEGKEQAFRSAAILMKETGASAVKLEGGAEMAETAAFLTARGIAVMGHIGLQPQSVHTSGGYRVTGHDEPEQNRIMNDAQALTKAGVFSIVLECMNPVLAQEITARIMVPTIGIGASSSCDGQILVTEDMIGLSGHTVPKFVKQYADLGRELEKAVHCYANEVRARVFPDEDHIYTKTNPVKKLTTVS
ncbi:MAG: 3-methyl-2-oxobutanoate hydroxymethyltransferase [Alphaproteobacteria bacterium CG_4_9_14_3_um_filter_47_13]|nr:MAG: 3-methyl-2-oxobutanoate hydroxymethyltransferase [Alphaproteobacteria bacterium CG_4_9_14_3_um_filter_47_13]